MKYLFCFLLGVADYCYKCGQHFDCGKVGEE